MLLGHLLPETGNCESLLNYFLLLLYRAFWRAPHKLEMCSNVLYAIFDQW
jgi:hypothetical protein